MTHLSLPLFFAAVVLLFWAHVMRCYRQTLLFPDRMLPWRFDLLLGLSLSHVVNTVLPWRLGELLRIAYVAMRYRLRPSYVGATVVAERLSDLVVVVLLAAVLVIREWGPRAVLLRLIVLLAITALLLVAFAIALSASRRLRRLSWNAASIFNARLRFGLIDLVWGFSQLVVGKSLLRREFLLLTGVMWTLYVGSYYLFAIATSTPWVDVGFVLLGSPGQSLWQQITVGGTALGQSALALFAFTLLPVGAVLLYGLLRNSGRRVLRAVPQLRRQSFAGLAIAQQIAGDRFSSRADYGAFLESHFSGSNAIISELALIATQDILVVRLLPGGSDAVTALIEENGVIKIRKCAAGGAGTKLAEQAEWMQRHAAALPLAPVIAETRGEASYVYDMPFLIGARDFYEVIHTSSLKESSRIVGEVVDRLHAFHGDTSLGDADDTTVDAYLRGKVVANAQQIHAFASVAFPDGHYRVNGVDYHLDEWQRLFDIDWLRGQLTERNHAIVHGDLTIENIIVCNDTELGWYVIDPNSSNVFNSPLIDWAKLMQSLHLGYEGLNRATQAPVRNGEIKVLFLRSNAYSTLHQFLSRRLEGLLGARAMREVAFHEIVNYLRLTPYKIRHHPEKALTFFACCSVLLRNYTDALAAEAVLRTPQVDAWAGVASPLVDDPSLAPVGLQ